MALNSVKSTRYMAFPHSKISAMERVGENVVSQSIPKNPKNGKESIGQY
jgi:hypothetical protein